MSDKLHNIKEIEEYIESLTCDYPICEYAFGDPSQIPFSKSIYTICESDCKRYQHSWACPPNAGTIEDNIQRLSNYKRFMLYSTIWEVSDAWNFDVCLFVRKQHEEMTRELRSRILEHYDLPIKSLADDPCPPIYFLSAGCAICQECACPDEPCRHPAERLMSMESHGIMIMKLAGDLGLTYNYNGTIAVYFSLILFG